VASPVASHSRAVEFVWRQSSACGNVYGSTFNFACDAACHASGGITHLYTIALCGSTLQGHAFNEYKRMLQSNENTFFLRLADSKEKFEQARNLILEYIRELNIDLGFQDLESELNGLSDQYAKPKGGLFIAYTNEEPVGVLV
jgi:hypothetical protein